ncbi:MAG: SIS domain-containing protein [Pseudomonadales bacterium]|nr:SIS domain-containing protein [Pseudomonadales bacterium]
MELTRRINSHFSNSIRLQQLTLERHSAEIIQAAKLLADVLLQGHKILGCGMGVCTAHAQYFCTALLNRYDRDRPGLPAIAISSDLQTIAAIAEDSSWQEIYVKQIKTLGQAGDVLLLLSIRRDHDNIAEIIGSAHARGMSVIFIANGDSAYGESLLQSGDVMIEIPAREQAGIVEVQVIILNCLCDLVDIHIFGDVT